MSDTSKSTTPPAGQAAFKIDNKKYYMSIDQNDPVEIGSVSYDINGVWPPSDYMIQQTFPKCTINYPLKTDQLKTLLETFQSHSGFLSNGDGNTFYVDVTTNAPTMFDFYFKILNGSYYMGVNENSVNNSIGKVSADILGVNPPDIDRIQNFTDSNGKKIFYKYWYAEGEYAMNNQIRLFHDHSGLASGGDGEVFPIHFFIGDH